MKRALLLVGMVVGLSMSAAWADDLQQCADLDDDVFRLACYDKLAGRRPPERSQQEADARILRDNIIMRCERDVGDMGAMIVKVCATQDIAAHDALSGYPAQHRSIIERCKRNVGDMGWQIVKVCADQDIDAEKALKRMRN